MKNAPASIHRPWYREFWPWALMLPPVLAVAGGVTMVVLAIETPHALVVEDYARIEELTSERFALDGEAMRLGLEATVAFTELGRVALDLRGLASADMPKQLILHLQHTTDPGADRHLVLNRAADRFTAEADVAPGHYRIELWSADRSWRLASHAVRPVGEILLQPQDPGG